MPQPIPSSTEEIASGVLNAAFQVHKSLGPGLLESVYERCLCHELTKRGLAHVRQATVPIRYDDLNIDDGLRLDILVEDRVIVELKAVERLLPVHEAQLLTYLKLTRTRLGLLLNFNSALLKDGIKRIAL